MKKTLLINFITILLFALFYQPTFAFGDKVFYDFDGNIVDEAQHEQITSDREKVLSMKLRNGYNVNSNHWKDPIKLRKQRIEQWKIMRSHYSPDSLPNKNR